MMPPLPFTLAAAVLIGYPLAQIVGIYLRRSQRQWFRTAFDWELHHAETDEDRTQIQTMMKYSRGDLGTPWRFAQLPWRMFLMSMRDGLAFKPPSPSQQGYDPLGDKENRLLFLRDRATELEILSHPILLCLIFPLVVIAWFMGGILYKARHPVQIRIPGMRDVVRGLAPMHELAY